MSTYSRRGSGMSTYSRRGSGMSTYSRRGSGSEKVARRETSGSGEICNGALKARKDALRAPPVREKLGRTVPDVPRLATFDPRFQRARAYVNIYPMFSKQYFLTPSFILVMMINLLACANTKPAAVAPNAAAQSSPTSQSRSPKQITPAELSKLRWIEGTWRGTGGEVPPFYERYKFENDSTLLVETLADETASKVTDESRFELKDGHFGSGTPDAGSVATAIDDNSISFAPLGKGNFFRFQRESDNSWKAILNWTDKNGAPKERVYLMERLPTRK